jgi:hypothetical protein
MAPLVGFKLLPNLILINLPLSNPVWSKKLETQGGNTGKRSRSISRNRSKTGFMEKRVLARTT